MIYSIIIPAYNEETLLPRTLSALSRAMEITDVPGEVIVVDNNSTDKTALIAREQGARVVFEPVNQISRARNTGARAARGRYFIFLDADTIISPLLLQTALDKMSKGSCCGGGVRIEFENSLNPMVSNVVNLWNRISVNMKFAAGCFIYCTRQAFEAVNGFSLKVYAGEEVWFSLHVQKWGQRRGMDFCIISEPAVVTSGRKLEWFSPLQAVLMVFAVGIIPFISWFRSLCPLWYKRPLEKENPDD